MRTPLLSIRVDAETKARWEAAAARDGLALSEFVRRAVERALLADARVDRLASAEIDEIVEVPEPRSASWLATKSFRPDFKEKHKPKR